MQGKTKSRTLKLNLDNHADFLQAGYKQHSHIHQFKTLRKESWKFYPYYNCVWIEFHT